MAKMQPFWWFLPPPCPSGEQILDGGFEAVDPWVYWIRSSSGVYQDSVRKHSGVYSCAVPRDEWVEQVIASEAGGISVRCIASFSLWVLGTGIYHYITLYYSDGTSTTTQMSIPIDGNWHQYNIMPLLDPNKTLTMVRYSYPVANPGGTQGNIDDVSLEGTGV